MAGITADAADLKIALIYSKTGPLEAYAKQTETGLMLGLEYLTGGTMMLDGRKIVVLPKDDQGKPDVAKSLLEQAYADDDVDLAIGTSSSGATHCDAAGRRGCQEDTAGRARGRRLHHRRQVESLHLPQRPQLIPGRARRRGRARQGRRLDRHAGAGLRLRPRRRRCIQGGAGGVAQRGQGGVRGIRAVHDHRLHRFGAAVVRCAEGPAGPQDHCRHLGRSQSRLPRSPT